MTTRRQWSKPADRFVRALARVDLCLWEPSQADVEGITSALVKVGGADLQRSWVRGELVRIVREARVHTRVSVAPSATEVRRDVERIGAAAAALEKAIADASPLARELVAIECNPCVLDASNRATLDSQSCVRMRKAALSASGKTRDLARLVGATLRSRGRPAERERVLVIVGLAIVFEKATGKKASQGRLFRTFVDSVLTLIEPKFLSTDRSVRKAVELAAGMRPESGWVLPADSDA